MARLYVEFRKGLNHLFTRRALETYLPGQEEVYKRYFQSFLDVTKKAGGKPVPSHARIPRADVRRVMPHIRGSLHLR